MARWFENKDERWTDEVVQLAKERVERGDIAHIVVATTTGRTGALFAHALRDANVDVVCVTHHAGFKAGDENQLEPDHAAAISDAGGVLLTGMHALSGVGRAISKSFGGATPVELIAHTLRLFGEGMKVCVEIAVMAADAGLIPTDCDVICVGGTGRGADTAVVLRASHANRFFEMRIRETLCRPIG